MSKTIKLEDQVYDKLDEFRGKHETYSQAVERLLALLSKVGELKSILEGQLNYAQFKATKLEELKEKVATRDSD
jgi:predicted CopG family antitoxin